MKIQNRLMLQLYNLIRRTPTDPVALFHGILTQTFLFGLQSLSGKKNSEKIDPPPQKKIFFGGERGKFLGL